MKEENKIGFFKKLKISIFNLEDYKLFASEKFSQSLKYIFSLISIVTLILSISTTISFRQKFDKLISYIQNEFPNFSYENETLSVEEFVEAYDDEYESKLIVDTGDVSDDQLETYKNEADDGYYSLILLKNKAIYKMSGYEYEATYSDIFNNLKINNFNKSDIFSNYLNENGMIKITIAIFVYAIIYLFVSNILAMLEDILIIGFFGWICSKITKVKLSFQNTCSLAIYSVTLSLILSTIYSIVNTFTGFEIKYFSLMYMIIAYIYIIAAILIIKSDPNKKVGQEIPVENKKKEDTTEIEKVDKEPKEKEDSETTEEKPIKKKKSKKKKETEGEGLPDGE